MNWSVWCLFVILVNPGSSYVNDVNDTTVLENKFARGTGRIVNGQVAKRGQFPYMVSLQEEGPKSEHFCGASIISERWIITAAHCVMVEYSDVEELMKLIVVAGETNLTWCYSASRQVRKVDHIVLHPRYDMFSLAHDIAMVSLLEPFFFTTFISPIPLAKQLPPEGTICSVSGWGVPGEKIHTMSEDLMFVELPLIHYDHCQELLRDISIMHPSMICAGYMEGGKGSCQGDSGGPLVCENLVTGIVSGGLGCARPKLPGFYANVVYYDKWIQEVLKTNETDDSPSPADNLTAVISASIFYVVSCLLVTVYLYEIVKV